MNNRKWGCLGLVVAVILAFSVLLNFGLLFRAMFGKSASSVSETDKVPKFEEEYVVKGAASDDKIALISLRGVISSSEKGTEGESMVDDIKIALQQAVDDKDVKAIVLNIDSPGGEVTASDVIYNAVKKARAQKPVVIYMGSLAASGGYYVSCGGSWLIANETTFTGSIGVIMETMNFQDLLGKVGVSPVVFKSGKFKDMLSPTREMTPEEKEYIQKMVMQTYDKFVGIVADERKLPVDELRNGIADGRVISGKDALADKLIDQLGLIEDAYDKARQLGHAPNASVVRYTPTFALSKLFKSLGAETNVPAQSKVEVNLTQKLMPQLEPGRIYLLPSFYAQ